MSYTGKIVLKLCVISGSVLRGAACQRFYVFLVYFATAGASCFRLCGEENRRAADAGERLKHTCTFELVTFSWSSTAHRIVVLRVVVVFQRTVTLSRHKERMLLLA